MLLITGANGQLGQTLALLCRSRGIAHRALSRQELDITDEKAVLALFSNHSFDCIVNCAAYTAVDAAQDNPHTAYAVNAFAPWLLARSGVPMLHLSTDYVFDGLAQTPYATHAAPRPLSVYGLSKRAGETALLEGNFQGIIVRTAWLYDKNPNTRNFYQTIRRLACERSDIHVVADQIGSPTYVVDLAQALLTLYLQHAHHHPMHILHFTNSGICSWYDFACAIVEQCGYTTNVHPISTHDYPTRAQRPRYSALSLTEIDAYGIRPRHWLQALNENSQNV